MESEIREQYEAQATLQKQNIEAQQGLNSGMLMNNQQQTQAALVQQINPEETVQEIRLMLEGKEELPSGDIKQVTEPLLNEEGINQMMLIVKSMVNINTIMSALDEKKIHLLMIELTDNVIDTLTLNWKQFGIKSKGDLDIIEAIIKNMTYPTLMRSKEGGERKFLGKITVENISTTPQFKSSKPEGFLSKFKI